MKIAVAYISVSTTNLPDKFWIVMVEVAKNFMADKECFYQVSCLSNAL